MAMQSSLGGFGGEKLALVTAQVLLAPKLALAVDTEESERISVEWLALSHAAAVVTIEPSHGLHAAIAVGTVKATAEPIA